ncbi:MAG: PadR family transcriptional regulator [Longimicrobiales bacterium]
MSTESKPFLPLHPTSFRVLMAALDGPTFGMAIVKKLEEASPNERLYPANLYRRIRDLLGLGLFEECDSPEGADPRRTYMRLTALGNEVARAEARRIRDIYVDARNRGLVGDA